MITCNRCGRCCLYDSNGIQKRCRYLIGEIGKITICRLYKNEARIGLQIDTVNGIPIICKPRLDVYKMYEGCPYNEAVTQTINTKLTKYS